MSEDREIYIESEKSGDGTQTFLQVADLGPVHRGQIAQEWKAKDEHPILDQGLCPECGHTLDSFDPTPENVHRTTEAVIESIKQIMRETGDRFSTTEESFDAAMVGIEVHGVCHDCMSLGWFASTWVSTFTSFGGFTLRCGHAWGLSREEGRQ